MFNVKENKVNLINLYKSKGYTHEISNVFKIIADSHLAIDTCTIVYTDYKNYYNSIKEYSTLFNIPVGKVIISVIKASGIRILSIFLVLISQT